RKMAPADERLDEGRCRPLADLVDQPRQSLGQQRLARYCRAEDMRQAGLVAGDVTFAFQAAQKSEDGRICPTRSVPLERLVDLADRAGTELPEGLEDLLFGFAELFTALHHHRLPAALSTTHCRR